MAVVDRETLPETVEQDSVRDVPVENEQAIDATIDETKTANRIETAQDRFARLARRPPSEGDGGNEDTETEQWRVDSVFASREPTPFNRGRRRNPAVRP